MPSKIFYESTIKNINTRIIISDIFHNIRLDQLQLKGLIIRNENGI